VNTDLLDSDGDASSTAHRCRFDRVTSQIFE